MSPTSWGSGEGDGSSDDGEEVREWNGDDEDAVGVTEEEAWSLGVSLSSDTNQLRSRLTPLDLFGALIAAGVHDVRHPGRTNTFTVAVADMDLRTGIGAEEVEDEVTAAIRYSAFLSPPPLNF